MTDTVRVPMEPTPEMVRAGCAVTCVECFADCKSSDAAAIYRAMLAASPQGEGSSADPAPIKPSADTGELRERVLEAQEWIGEAECRRGCSTWRPDVHGRSRCDCGREDALNAILDLIQSERAGSSISQNDQPGLAFSGAGEP